ncbi:hypothetical protein D3C78_1813420 [compost metagenome]
MRPSSRPRSSAFSTSTLNQLSILRVRNCAETVNTSMPGSSAIRVNITTSFCVSLAPNSRLFTRRRRRNICRATTASRPTRPKALRPNTHQ